MAHPVAPPRLQTLLVGITAWLTFVTLGLCVALVAITTRLHEASRDVAAAVESVRISHEAAIELLVHHRAQDGIVRDDLAGDLRRRLDDAGAHVTSGAEAEILADARGAVAGYLATGAGHDQAYAAIGRLVEINAAQGRDALRRTALWNATADTIAAAVAAATALVSIALLWWLHARAFQPMVALARTMTRFGAGDRDARAAERGPAEVRAMSHQFNAMAEGLAAQRRSQIAVLAGVAHDLRNPLTVMRMTLEELTDGAPLPERARARLQRGVDRIERMVGDFLDVSRIEAGQLRLEPRTFDVVGLVEEVVSAARAGAAGHALVIDRPDAPVLLGADPDRLEQALGNLVGNAIKYSPAGGVVEVAVAAEDGEVAIQVRDHGVGMSDEDRARLFEPFRRVGEHQIPGIGLGLFVTRGIVEAHGGTLEVDSAPGRGATFTIRFGRRSSSPPLRRTSPPAGTPAACTGSTAR